MTIYEKYACNKDHSMEYLEKGPKIAFDIFLGEFVQKYQISILDLIYVMNKSFSDVLDFHRIMEASKDES